MTEVQFLRPRNVDEAIDYLIADENARALAGGQSLVATMALGLYNPSTLVTLIDLAELRGIERRDDGSLHVGAMTTHAEIAVCTLLEEGQSVISSAAAQIASPAVRNFGTIGGSCALGDSASDWPSALLAASAIIHVSGPSGHRAIPAEEFFVGFLTTDLGLGELITRIEIPPLPGRGLHRKLVRAVGDYPTLSVSVVAARSGNHCYAARIAVGAYAATPVQSDSANATLVGPPISDALARQAGRLLVDAGEPTSDSRGSADYRKRVLPDFAARTVIEVLTL